MVGTDRKQIEACAKKQGADIAAPRRLAGVKEVLWGFARLQALQQLQNA